MSHSNEMRVDGTRGRLAVTYWIAPTPHYVLLLAHGYGEHSGRYEHVAARLIDHGAAVYAPDHFGHGRSGGEPALVEDIDDLVADIHRVRNLLADKHPNLPVVLLGHSMGALVATRYAQEHGAELTALVLSAFIGGNPDIERLLKIDPMPEVPLDPVLLSRDPEVAVAYARDPRVWQGSFKRASLKAIFQSIGTIQGGPSIGSLPTLWLHGEEDALAPVTLASEVLKCLDGTALEAKIYAGARHEVFNEINRNEVIADLLDFLNRQIGSPAQPQSRDE